MAFKHILTLSLFLAIAGISLQAQASLPDEKDRVSLVSIDDSAQQAAQEPEEFMPQLASTDQSIYFPAKMQQAETQGTHFGWALLVVLSSIAFALWTRFSPQPAKNSASK